MDKPEHLLSRTFCNKNPIVWKEEVVPMLRSWKLEDTQPTITHKMIHQYFDIAVICDSGLLKLIKDGDRFKTVKAISTNDQDDLLVPVFKDGVLLKDYTLDEIRVNAFVN